MARALYVHAAVADHPAGIRARSQPAQRFADQVRLVAQAAVDGGADDLLEAVAERQVCEDPAGMRLVLRRDHREPVSVRMQRPDGLADAGVHLVLEPAVRLEAFQIVLDGGFDPGRIAQQRHETGAQRRADPAPQFLLGRDRMFQLRQRVRDAAGDADGRIDQRAVQIEEQRGATHAPRASSAATAGSVLPSRNSRNAPPPVEM